MSLADYQPERREIKLKGGSLEIGAITPTHLATLIRTHLPDLEAILELIQKGSTLNAQQGTEFVSSLVAEAPGLAANIIALACDEKDATANAAKLPFPVQVDVIMQVADMTFNEVGGVKKFLGTLASLLKNNPGMVEKATRTLARKAE